MPGRIQHIRRLLDRRQPEVVMADSKTELSEVATTPHDRKSKPRPAGMDRLLPATGYAVLSLIGLGVFLSVGWFLLDSPAMADASATSDWTYYVLLAVLALAAAAFLFGAMRSTAKLIGGRFGPTLELGGPVLIAALVLLGGFWLTRSSEESTLVFQIKSTDPITDASEASVRVSMGNRIVKQPFSTFGEASLSGVSSRFRDKDIYVQLESRIYRLKDNRTTYRIPATFVVVLEVVRVPSAELDPQTLHRARNELLLLNIVRASRGVPMDLWSPVPVAERPPPRRQLSSALLRPVDRPAFGYFIRQGYSRELLFWLFSESIRVSLVGKTIEFLND